MIKILNFIDGQFHEPKDNLWLDNVLPANGEIYSQLPNSNKSDIDFAYQAANKAFPQWSQTDTNQRAKILSKIADLIEQNIEQFAAAESKDNGKPIKLARTVDIPRAASNFRFFAQAITQFSSESHESVGQNAINYTLRKPLGVVACISPWNLPLYLFTWKIAPALAAGNCVIAKPSEVTPMTAYMLGEICQEAGLPGGVLNIVHGEGQTTGQALIEHPEIKAISFTGGTSTGRHIAKLAGSHLKKVSLELGGKNPNIIFADCDYEKMLDTTMRSSFANQGQICLCGSRILVEQSIYEKFKTDFIARTSKLVVSNPENQEADLGALVSQAHMQKVLSYIKLAKQGQGKLLYGGNRVTIENHEKGYYLEPTVIEIDSLNCELNQEEIFGPVVTLMPFSTEEEALQIANSTEYGLSASVWTNDLKRTMKFTQELEAGIIWVNTWMLRDLRTPFGGLKASGMGREGGLEALRFFTETKNVCIQY